MVRFTHGSSTVSRGIGGILTKDKEPRYYIAGPDEGAVRAQLERLKIEWLSPQQEKIINDNRRLILVAGGERAGKSFISALYGTTRTLYGDRFWIVGPDYELARPEFDYWVSNLLRLGAIASDRDISRPKIGKAQAFTKTGQIIETKTSDDVKKLAAVAPDGIIMTEAAQHEYDSYLRCLGRVGEKRGWLLMSGTFEGSEGWFVELFNDWQDDNNVEGATSYSMPTWSNTLVYPGGRNDPEILRMELAFSRVEGFFEERFGARPVPPAWLVFREFRHSTHYDQHLRFKPGHEVYIGVDPSGGGNPYAVVACQFFPDVYDPTIDWVEEMGGHPDPIDFCHVIDVIYETGKIGEEVIEIAQQRPWWDMVRGGAIDVEAPDERKRWLKFAKVNLKAKKWTQLEGIRRTKSFLYLKRHPKTHEILAPPHVILGPKAKDLAWEYSKYKRKPPKDTDGAVKPDPPKDQHNHAIKALWYLLLARYGPVKGASIARVAHTWRRKA